MSHWKKSAAVYGRSHGNFALGSYLEHTGGTSGSPRSMRNVERAGSWADFAQRLAWAEADDVLTGEQVRILDEKYLKGRHKIALGFWLLNKWSKDGRGRLKKNAIREAMARRAALKEAQP